MVGRGVVPGHSFRELTIYLDILPLRTIVEVVAILATVLVPVLVLQCLPMAVLLPLTQAAAR
jgi:hypothetical protein